MDSETCLSRFPAEFLLLAASIRPHVEVESCSRLLSAAGSRFDWDGFRNLTARHRVVPQVLRGLNLLPAGAVPDGVLTALRGASARNARRAVELAAALVRLVELLRAQAIPVLAYKGPVLALQAAGSLTARHAGDLDVLVPVDCMERVDGVLRNHAYQRIAPASPLSPAQRRAYGRLNHHYEYVHGNTRTRIEVHWRLFKNPHFWPDGFKQLAERSTTVLLADRPVSTLSIDDALLLSLAHGARHNWFRLFWLCDVAELIHHHPRLDASRVMTAATRMGLARPIAQGLTLSHLLLGAEAPPAAARTSGVEALVVRSLRRLSRPATETLSWTSGIRDLRYELALRPDRRYRRACLSRRLLRPEDWSAVDLPDRWFSLYYALRPFLWIGRRLGLRY